MSSRPRVISAQVTMQVDTYVDKALRDAHLYENCSPLDDSGVFSLHVLAAEIYAAGFEEGERVADLRHHAAAAREHREQQWQKESAGE